MKKKAKVRFDSLQFMYILQGASEIHIITTNQCLKFVTMNFQIQLTIILICNAQNLILSAEYSVDK